MRPAQSIAVAKRSGRRREKRARSRSASRPVAQRKLVDERRSIAVGVQEIGGVPVSEPHTLVVVEPIRLLSGEDLYFQTPFLVPFYLLKAKSLRDTAEPKRAAALTETHREQDGTLRPLDPSAAFDALEDLALAVIVSAAAIEAHANDIIGRLPEDAMVEIPTRVGSETIIAMRDKTAMDRLSLGEKLTRAVPLYTGRASIKGTAAWQKYRGLVRLRNALVHMKREAINDPMKPGPFGRLMLGEGSRAPEDAADVIEALEPGWMPKEVRPELGLSMVAPVLPPSGPT